MTTGHHPTEATLLEYFDGSLDEGRRIVVAAHVEMCSSCRRLLSGMEAVAADYLDALPPAPLGDGALARTISRLDVAPVERGTEHSAAVHDLPVELRALAPYALGPWRWIGPGVYWRSVAVPERARSRVFLLKAAPGTHLPQHTHEGTELTVILKGAFRHAGGRFGAGDCDDADDSVEHSPIVEDREECVCLVAMEGSIKLRSFLGRLIQPLVRL
jgi:putative transcriptional regulator